MVELSGVSANDQLPTAISARSISRFGGGNAGNVQIDTRQLVIRDGASLAVSSQGSGSAGNQDITAPGNRTQFSLSRLVLTLPCLKARGFFLQRICLP